MTKNLTLQVGDNLSSVTMSKDTATDTVRMLSWSWHVDDRRTDGGKPHTVLKGTYNPVNGFPGTILDLAFGVLIDAKAISEYPDKPRNAVLIHPLDTEKFKALLGPHVKISGTPPEASTIIKSATTSGTLSPAIKAAIQQL